MACSVPGSPDASCQVLVVNITERLPGGAEADGHFDARAQRGGETGIEAGGQSVRAVTNGHFFAELEGGIVGQPHAAVRRTVRAKLSLANQQRGDGGGIEITSKAATG